MPNTNDKNACLDSDEVRLDSAEQNQNNDDLDAELQADQSDDDESINNELKQMADSNNDDANNKENESAQYKRQPRSIAAAFCGVTPEAAAELSSDELFNESSDEHSDEHSDELSDELSGEPSDEFDLDVNKLDEQEEQKITDENVVVLKSKMILAKKLLTNIKESNDRLIQILSGLISSEDEAIISIGQMSDDQFEPSNNKTADNKIIEGVFDGENMIGPDGKQYSVPANYASKSKLVEGDILKLTITADGTFIYKQIGPIERNRIVGKLERSSDGSYTAAANDENWRILTASITYFKGEPGDEIVILIPKTGKSKWATVENIVRKTEN